jgi:hypothetical protein
VAEQTYVTDVSGVNLSHFIIPFLSGDLKIQF